MSEAKVRMLSQATVTWHRSHGMPSHVDKRRFGPLGAVFVGQASYTFAVVSSWILWLPRLKKLAVYILHIV